MGESFFPPPACSSAHHLNTPGRLIASSLMCSCANRLVATLLICQSPACSCTPHAARCVSLPR
eukprot:9477035-Pyramimonas_sp.AAC.1